jgi:ribosomal protein S12 methylthiotransferase accessory factor
MLNTSSIATGLIEPTIRESLLRFKKNLNNLNFIKNVYKRYQDNDEIKFYQYSSQIEITKTDTDGRLFSDTKPGGSSIFSEDLALLKCLGETVERVCTQCYKENELTISSYKNLKSPAINPKDFEYFSKSQLKNKHYQKFCINNDSIFSWKKGYSLDDKKQILIPTQMIHYSYQLLSNEPKIYNFISTGAAGGGSFLAALLRGILEVIERDSFMIFYLNKLPGKKINYKSIKNKKIDKIIELCDRYLFEWHLVDITTDLGIPTFASILIDRSGIGPAVSIGLKSSFQTLEAIVGSFEECLHPRNSIRHMYEDIKKNTVKTDQITNISNRALFWYKNTMIENLDFWLKNNETEIDLSDNVKKTDAENLVKIKKIFNNQKIDCYYVDITREDVKKIPYYVLKVIIPKLHPLYLDENYPYLGGNRLKEVPLKLGYKPLGKLNKVPHPFL